MVFWVEKLASVSFCRDCKEPLRFKDDKNHDDGTANNVGCLQFTDDIGFYWKINLKEPVKEKKHLMITFNDLHVSL